MSYSTSQQQQYSEPNKPYWLIWVAVILLSLVALGVCGQSCTIGTFLDAPRGETIECTFYPSNLPLPLTYANDGYPGLYQLTGTQFNTFAALTDFYNYTGLAPFTAWVYTDFVEINGLAYGYWRPLEIPEPPPTCPNEIFEDISFSVNFADNFSQLSINYYDGNPEVLIIGCNGLMCKKLRYVTLSNDTRVMFSGEYEFFQIWWDRCNYTTLNF